MIMLKQNLVKLQVIIEQPKAYCIFFTLIYTEFIFIFFLKNFSMKQEYFEISLQAFNIQQMWLDFLVMLSCVLSALLMSQMFKIWMQYFTSCQLSFNSLPTDLFYAFGLPYFSI